VFLKGSIFKNKASQITRVVLQYDNEIAQGYEEPLIPQSRHISCEIETGKRCNYAHQLPEQISKFLEEK
jgi:hypothetical protein